MVHSPARNERGEAVHAIAYHLPPHAIRKGCPQETTTFGPIGQGARPDHGLADVGVGDVDLGGDGPALDITGDLGQLAESVDEASVLWADGCPPQRPSPGGNRKVHRALGKGSRTGPSRSGIRLYPLDGPPAGPVHGGGNGDLGVPPMGDGNPSDAWLRLASDETDDSQSPKPIRYQTGPKGAPEAKKGLSIGTPITNSGLPTGLASTSCP